MIGALRSRLSAPWAYRLLGALIGAHSARATLAREYVRPRSGQRLLDIGCGTGNMLPYLEGVDYLGFDASPEYVASARSLYGSRARFICERVSEHDVQRYPPFDQALAAGVLHHLDDGEALQLLRVAHASLKPGGRLVTLDGCYREGQQALARYFLSRDRGQHVRSSEEYLQLANRVFGEVRATVREDLLRIPYTHIILECTRTTP